MRNLSAGQLKAASEILGNIAVAWFTIGVISPLLLGTKNSSEFILFLGFGLTMSGLFTIFSLLLVRSIKR